MYHTLAQQSTIDLVENHPNLKALVRELTHKFNAYVMAHDASKIEKVSGSSDNVIRRNTHVLLTKENGLPFGVAFVGEGSDREGKIVPDYSFMSNIVVKAKGRGHDRTTRSSINMKALMKSLEKDYDNNYDAQYALKSVADALGYTTYQEAKRIAKVGWNDGSIGISNDLTKKILLERFEGIQLTEESVEKLRSAYKDLLKSREKCNLATEIMSRFLTQCYLVIRPEFCPAVVTKINLDHTTDKDGDKDVKVTFHDEVKCYSTMDALAEAHNDLALSIKMFNTKHQIDQRQHYPEYALSPIYNDLPRHYDKLDADLDILAWDTNITGFGDFRRIDVLLIPIAKYE